MLGVGTIAVIGLVHARILLHICLHAKLSVAVGVQLPWTCLFVCKHLTYARFYMDDHQ